MQQGKGERPRLRAASGRACEESESGRREGEQAARRGGALFCSWSKGWHHPPPPLHAGREAARRSLRAGPCPAGGRGRGHPGSASVSRPLTWCSAARHGSPAAPAGRAAAAPAARQQRPPRPDAPRGGQDAAGRAPTQVRRDPRRARPGPAPAHEDGVPADGQRVTGRAGARPAARRGRGPRREEARAAGTAPEPGHGATRAHGARPRLRHHALGHHHHHHDVAARRWALRLRRGGRRARPRRRRQGEHGGRAPARGEDGQEGGAGGERLGSGLGLAPVLVNHGYLNVRTLLSRDRQHASIIVTTWSQQCKQ